MIDIVKNSWRPFILLHDKEGREVYFDVTKKPTITQYEDCTELYMNANEYVDVKESAKDIIAAVDAMIADEQQKKAEEAVKYMEQTKARVLETEKAIKAAQGK